MTSNAGAHTIGTGRAMGFGASQKSENRDYEAMKESVMKEVKDIFRPEFINRVDELIVFHALTETEIREITGLMLRQVAERLEEQEIHLTWDEAVVDKLSRDGYDPRYGARPLRRLIQRTVEDTLSEELLSGQVQLGQEARLTVEEDRIIVRGIPGKEPEAAPAEQTESAGTAEEESTLG